MYDYKTDTDWTRNKNSASIIYPNANGKLIEITLEVFLKQSTENTVEKFNEIKALSDKLFHAEDIADGEHAKNEIPLYEWANTFASETLEEQLIDSPDRANHQAYLKRRKEMVTLVPDILDRLTEIQRRRFMLHKVKKLTTRKIAEIEKVSQQSVCECINGAEKKIEKILLKITLTTKKYPVKQDE